jgi:sacsin
MGAQLLEVPASSRARQRFGLFTRAPAAAQVGTSFAEPARVAFGGGQLAPWLYCIPAELSPFRELLLQLGVRESFTADQYVQVLESMAAAAGPEAALPEEQLGQALAVVQRLADMQLPPATRLLVPDASGVLASTTGLAFNDAPWLWEGAGGGPDAAGGLPGAEPPAGGPPGLRLVHRKISNAVAAKLGVASLRRMLLAQSADSMALGAPCSACWGWAVALCRGGVALPLAACSPCARLPVAGCPRASPAARLA